MNKEYILSALYDLSLAVGGETSSVPLITKALQRLLYHTTNPCGMYLRWDDNDRHDHIEALIEVAIGCQYWSDRIGTRHSFSRTLISGPSAILDDSALLQEVRHPSFDTRHVLRLQLTATEVILLLSAQPPAYQFPATYVFDPVLRNLGKNIALCRRNEANLQALHEENELRRVAEESLREEHELFMAGPIVMFKCAPTGNWPVLYVSSNIEMLYGYRSDELASGGMAWGDIIHPDDIERVRSVELRSTPRGNRFYTIEYRILDRDGGIHWVNDYTVPYLDEHGEVTHLLGYIVDITERHSVENEHRLLATAFESNEAIAITDARNRIVRVNKGFSTITGYSADEVIGKTPGLLRSGRHSTAFYNKMWEQLSATGHWEGEIWNRRKSGEVYPEWLNITAVANDRAEVTHYVAHFTDISLLKSQEQQLERTAEEERVLGKLLKLALATTDLKEYLNTSLALLINSVSWLSLLPKGAVFITDDTQDDVLQLVAEYNLGEELSERCHNVAFGQCLCGRVASDKAFIYAAHIDERHDTLPKNVEPHGHYAAPLLDNDQLLGVITLYIPDGHPITEQDQNFVSRVATVFSLGVQRRNTEQALVVARDEAERANSAKSEFLSSMSHELRTPLNAVLGFAQLLELDATADTDVQNVQEILKAGNHLLTLINEVLDLAKVEAGRVELSIESICIADLLDEAIALTAPLAQQRQIRLHIDDANNDAWIHADHTRVKQVLLNFLSNAIKYNRDAGSVTITRTITAEGRLRLGVTDTGAGIPADKLGELFQPFNRLDAEKSTVEGTGIGLVISKRLIELMGGTIGVESEPGTGSTFWFELPLATPLSIGDEDNLSGQQASAAHTHQSTILYVEDNPANLRLVTQVLGKRPQIRLITAHEPELGLSLANSDPPDLVLLDINLPVMDGFEVLKRLRACPETAAIPVIAVSANAMLRDIERGLAAGFNDYLTKPIDINKFLATIDRFLAS